MTQDLTRGSIEMDPAKAARIAANSVPTWDGTADSWRDPNPWHPMTSPIDLKHLGKLGEELNEAGSAVSRCIIQGIDEAEPVTGKVNKVWLEDELADVLANIELCVDHFGLDTERMRERGERKKKHLRTWHGMIDD